MAKGCGRASLNHPLRPRCVDGGVAFGLVGTDLFLREDDRHGVADFARSTIEENIGRAAVVGRGDAAMVKPAASNATVAAGESTRACPAHESSGSRFRPARRWHFTHTPKISSVCVTFAYPFCLARRSRRSTTQRSSTSTLWQLRQMM